jgi:cell division protein FtsI (penicillin-binding protein 3)
MAGFWRPATLLKLNADMCRRGRRVFSAATSARMRQLLRLIVMYGTGKTADAPGYRIGGKTGTAEKPEGGRYSHNANITTFAAAFPMDNPQYVVRQHDGRAAGQQQISRRPHGGLHLRAGRQAGGDAHRPDAGNFARSAPRC